MRARERTHTHTYLLGVGGGVSGEMNETRIADVNRC